MIPELIHINEAIKFAHSKNYDKCCLFAVENGTEIYTIFHKANSSCHFTGLPILIAINSDKKIREINDTLEILHFMRVNKKMV